MITACSDAKCYTWPWTRLLCVQIKFRKWLWSGWKCNKHKTGCSTAKSVILPEKRCFSSVGTHRIMTQHHKNVQHSFSNLFSFFNPKGFFCPGGQRMLWAAGAAAAKSQTESPGASAAASGERAADWAGAGCTPTTASTLQQPSNYVYILWKAWHKQHISGAAAGTLQIRKSPLLRLEIEENRLKICVYAC